MPEIFDANMVVSFATLVLMEIVLGIDNIVFISILCSKLPKHQQKNARNLGIFLALVFRVILLMGISSIAKLTTPLFTLLDRGISGRDLIMLIGGLFLLAKATLEIHKKLETDEHDENAGKALFWQVIAQVVALDVVFSLDSVITAVGLVDNVGIMIAAVVISLFVMLAFSGYICDFIAKHPTMKMLALSFLLMIGLLLFIEGLGIHVPKGYIYFAMAFSIFVEVLNTKVRKKMGKHG